MENLTNCVPLEITPSEWGTSKLCLDYVEILRLAQMCANRGIPYTLSRLYDGWIVILTKDGKRIADAIEHNGSYGHTEDLLETKDFYEDAGDVTGWLTALEVWERIENLYHLKIESGQDNL